jgi:hypothetical protein
MAFKYGSELFAGLQRRKVTYMGTDWDEGKVVVVVPNRGALHHCAGSRIQCMGIFLGICHEHQSHTAQPVSLSLYAVLGVAMWACQITDTAVPTIQHSR